MTPKEKIARCSKWRNSVKIKDTPSSAEVMDRVYARHAELLAMCDYYPEGKSPSKLKNMFSWLF